MNILEKQWNRFARLNPRYYIYANPAHADSEKFFGSGLEDVRTVLTYLPAETRKGTLCEIGCGVGRMSRHFARVFDQVMAVDLSEVMIEKAKEEHRTYTNILFRKCESSGHLPSVPIESADVVVSWHVFQHIPSMSVIQNYIRETHRVLKPTGIGILHFDTRRKNLASELLALLPPPMDVLLPPRYRFGMRRIRRSSELLRSSLNEARLMTRQEINPDGENHLFIVAKPTASEAARTV